MSKTLEHISKLCQACSSNNPVVVLGSGASVPYQIAGMSDLATWLRDHVQPLDEAESEAWTLVRTALHKGDHLEAALEGVAIPAALLRKVVRATWDCIAASDYAVLKRIVANTERLPLRALLNGLARTTNRTINIVTTNYDRVAEYAADSSGLLHNNGFLPGYIRTNDGARDLQYRIGQSTAKTVRLWKVHGSLDWFETSDGRVVSLPLTTDLPDGLNPLIVTPGVSKYQRTHEEPFRSAIQGADNVLRAAPAFICIGYGFRDAHIHPKIVERCSKDDVPILIAARTLTPEAKAFLNQAGRRFIALEHHSDGTMAYFAESPKGELVRDVNIWSLEKFNEVVGF